MLRSKCCKKRGQSSQQNKSPVNGFREVRTAVDERSGRQSGMNEIRGESQWG